MEAVYQWTVAELLCHGGAFWLVFTPLAVDATAVAMQQVVEEIRRREPEEHARAKLYGAMLVLAKLDPWGHNLFEEIKRMVEEIDKNFVMDHPFLREVFENGMKQGVEKFLKSLFVKRLHRELSPAEQDALAARARTLDVERAAEEVVDLEADALLAWLLGPAAE